MITDFNMYKKKRALQEHTGMTDEEIARVVKTNWDGVHARFDFGDFPFDPVGLPDGSTAESRDEVERLYAERGERI